MAQPPFIFYSEQKLPGQFRAAAEPLRIAIIGEGNAKALFSFVDGAIPNG
jgi:hypothetical protein